MRFTPLAGLVLAALVAACGDDTTGPGDPEPVVASVHISPAERALVPGQTAALTATPIDPDGRPIPGRSVQWVSSKPAVATVEAGVVTAVAPGTAQVTATVAGKNAHAAITVAAVLEPVASVALSLSDVALAPGTSVVLVATTRNGAGAPLPGREIVWTTQSAAVATVGADGTVTGVADGTTTVTATSEGKSAQAAVTVSTAAGPVVVVELDATEASLEEGQGRQLVATPKDAQGEPVGGRGMTWTSSDPGVAYVSAGGLVTAIRTGTATVTVKVDGRTASAAITVTAAYGYDLLFDAPSEPNVTTRWMYRLDITDAAAAPAPILSEAGGLVAGSPDGSRIAFTGAVGGWPGLHVANSDGSGVKRITNGLEDLHPAWSPDGTTIAFARKTGEANDWDIWVIPAGGGDAVNLTADMGADEQNWPTWSPAAIGRIAFQSRAQGEYHIWTMNADGSDKQEITRGLGDVEPSWSPDGSTIAFQRSGAAIFGDIWLVDAAGGNERSLMYPLAGPQWMPAWSPDGRLIAFQSRHETYGGEGDEQIYTVWADGSKLARRTSGAGSKSNPSWLVR